MKRMAVGKEPLAIPGVIGSGRKVLASCAHRVPLAAASARHVTPGSEHNRYDARREDAKIGPAWGCCPFSVCGVFVGRDKERSDAGPPTDKTDHLVGRRGLRAAGPTLQPKTPQPVREQTRSRGANKDTGKGCLASGTPANPVPSPPAGEKVA